MSDGSHHDHHNNNDAAERGLAFLKNAESLLVAVILAIILWVGNTTYNNSLSLTKMATQVDTLVGVQAKEIAALQAGLTTNVRRIDGILDTLWPRLREIKERLQQIETKHADDPRVNSNWKY